MKLFDFPIFPIFGGGTPADPMPDPIIDPMLDPIIDPMPDPDADPGLDPGDIRRAGDAERTAGDIERTPGDEPPREGGWFIRLGDLPMWLPVLAERALDEEAAPGDGCR